jgi:hypothetical protein
MKQHNEAFLEARRRVCGLPDDPSVKNWEVGLVDGQLLPHGGSRELILAVADGDHDQARAELNKLPEPKRSELGKIVKRLAPIVAATR